MTSATRKREHERQTPQQAGRTRREPDHERGGAQPDQAGETEALLQGREVAPAAHPETDGRAARSRPVRRG